MESCLALTHLEVEGDPGFSGEKTNGRGSLLEAELFWESIDRRLFVLFLFKLIEGFLKWWFSY